MDIVFNNKELEKLFTTGRSKKYRYSEHILRKYVEVVQIIYASKDIYDFWALKSLKFEKLINYSNRYSFRINNKYRLEVLITWENNEQTIGIVGIEELSNHYK